MSKKFNSTLAEYLFFPIAALFAVHGFSHAAEPTPYIRIPIYQENPNSSPFNFTLRDQPLAARVPGVEYEYDLNAVLDITGTSHPAPDQFLWSLKGASAPELQLSTTGVLSGLAEGEEPLEATVSVRYGGIERTRTYTIPVNTMTETIRVGDAPARVTSSEQFVTAWFREQVESIEHTARADLESPVWSGAFASILNSSLLSGGDIYNGDIGVSGQTVFTSTVKQEIDGTEALRFTLKRDAFEARIDLSLLYGATAEDGGHFEAGRVRLLDKNGVVVKEAYFHSLNPPTGSTTYTVTSPRFFRTVEIAPGAINGGRFDHGALVDEKGNYTTSIYADGEGVSYGSEFLVDWIDFVVPGLFH